MNPHLQRRELKSGEVPQLGSSVARLRLPQLNCTTLTYSFRLPLASSPDSGSFKCHLMSHLLRFVVFAFLFGTDKK